jgi:hypothetical protein
VVRKQRQMATRPRFHLIDLTGLEIAVLCDLLTKLEFCRYAFDGLDKSLCDKLIAPARDVDCPAFVGKLVENVEYAIPASDRRPCRAGATVQVVQLACPPHGRLAVTDRQGDAVTGRQAQGT